MRSHRAFCSRPGLRPSTTSRRIPTSSARFVAACGEAARYTNAHPRETINLVATFSGLDPALLQHSVRSITADAITLADVQRPIDFAYKYGIIDKPFDASAVLAAGVPISRR